jgi:hypothetical protein
VKVGNRQAPLQHQKPHPKKVGFLRLRARNSTGLCHRAIARESQLSFPSACDKAPPHSETRVTKTLSQSDRPWMPSPMARHFVFSVAALRSRALPFS